MKKLTVKETSFAAKIITGLEPSAALRASKYKTNKLSPESIKANAQQLLRKTHIALTIEKGKQKLIDKSIMTREEALKKLTSHARVVITDVFNFHLEEFEVTPGVMEVRTVWEIKPSEDIELEVAACIKSISFDSNGRPKIETYDSDGAIKQLSLMQGWNAAKEYDHKSSDGTMSPTRQLSDDEVKEQMEARGLKVGFDE